MNAGPSALTSPPINLLGIAVDSVTMDDAVARIEAMIHGRQSHQVATANVDFLVQTQNDAELRKVLREADLVLCDGMPLVWASRLFGNKLPERVTGADLVPRLLTVSERKGYRPYFLGGSPVALNRALHVVEQRHPGLEIAGHYAPPHLPIDKMPNEEIVDRIRAAKPDILFVAFGCPKAEKWIARHRWLLDVPVMMGIGGTIDFLAGDRYRAPQWVQRIGAEWLVRLAQEPRRLFRRYATDCLQFAPALLRQWWQMATAHSNFPAPTPALIAAAANWQLVAARGWLDIHALQGHALRWEYLVRAERHCLLDLSGAVGCDGTFVAWLQRLRGMLHRDRRDLVLVAPSEPVRRVLGELRLDDYFPCAPDFRSARRLLPTTAGGAGPGVRLP